MQALKDEIIQKLQAFLISKESIPIRDGANIIIPDGVNSAATVQAIKDCIKIVKGCKNESTSENT